MGQFQFILSLVHWYLGTHLFEFEWDLGNAVKSSRKHGVGRSETEEVFRLKLAIPLGKQVSPAVAEDRFCIVGPTRTGKIVSVVFALRKGKIRPISTRPASRKERAIYEENLRTTFKRI